MGAYTDAEILDLKAFYRRTLLEDAAPFWIRHGVDRECGGFLTALDRDGSVIDTDKSVWFQGRGAWMFATLYRTVEKNPEWLAAARGAADFMARHGFAPNGKMLFTVTREGVPLRLRRYYYSEAFAAAGFAAVAAASGEEAYAELARRTWGTYVRSAFTPAMTAAKSMRPAKGLAPLMMAIFAGQEVREALGDIEAAGATCSQWIDRAVEEIRRDFMKPDLRAVLECVAPDGSLIDHFDGRLINPGHAIEAAWFILRESMRRGDAATRRAGLDILDWMWERGWDEEHGGILYFRDVRGRPVQEYWQDMKFWWLHCEAVIATWMAFGLTGEAKHADRHRLVHDWSFKHFADPEFGEWYGYLHHDGTPSVRLKGNMWKGPFHYPRMLWVGSGAAGYEAGRG